MNKVLRLEDDKTSWVGADVSGRCGFKKGEARGFPGGAVVENPPANAGDKGSSPGLGRSHMPRSN